ncbi:hypothetical protein BC936DRAFT_136961 [Jimgerdemannia flammicorona]|uniref:RRM domain-containing protein n=1 Tax=Jimgerdemannia flammicorona TaxID=994334 RepID=A0A433CYD5_9FUNG|nr:hypothetical protein BC936DRAFT_136961 [Jimgerdemannia flammicorona]
MALFLALCAHASARPGSFASRGYGDRDGGRDRGSGGRDRDRVSSPNRERYGSPGGSDRYPPRERPVLELPTVPPFTAHVANLPFDTTDDDLGGFFDGLKCAHGVVELCYELFIFQTPIFMRIIVNSMTHGLPLTISACVRTHMFCYVLRESHVSRIHFFVYPQISKIRIVKDHDEKPKGFGYVEFEDQESLKNALTLSGEQFNSRQIRINIAEPPREREPRSPGEDRTEASSWRRATPVEPSRPRGSGGFGDRDRSDRSSDRSGFGGDRGDRGGVRDRSAGSGFNRDRDVGDRGFGRDRDRDSRTDTEWRGGAFSTNRNAGSSGGFERKEGGGGFGRDRGGFGAGRSSDSVSSPSTRPRLQLQARSTGSPTASSATAPPPATETYQTSKKPNPFGDAKPIDSDEAIRRVEEKRKQREAELQKKHDEKKAAEGAKAEENGDAQKEIE